MSGAPDGYLLDSQDMQVLRRVMQRLYAPTTLGADEKRDLANTMEVVLHRASPINAEDLAR